VEITSMSSSMSSMLMLNPVSWLSRTRYSGKTPVQRRIDMR
jgi:hypothetical protein